MVHSFVYQMKVIGKESLLLNVCMEKIIIQIFYSFLIAYYLLALSYENSQLRVNDKKGSIEKLIIRITNFSAQFYQPEVHSRIFGRKSI